MLYKVVLITLEIIENEERNIKEEKWKCVKINRAETSKKYNAWYIKIEKKNVAFY